MAVVYLDFSSTLALRSDWNETAREISSGGGSVDCGLPVAALCATLPGADQGACGASV
jgi:hypothetical protein